MKTGAGLVVPNIVGITGYAQHGKNTVGRVFEDLGYNPLGFADALRELALRVDPLVTCEECAGGEYFARYSYILQSEGYERAKVDYPEVRRILQELGTGVRDTVGENAWVGALTKKLMPGTKYVITDVRFPNEARALTSLGGEIWRVDRPGFDNGLGTSHPSEAYVAELNYMVSVTNDGGLLELEQKVKGIIGARGLA